MASKKLFGVRNNVLILNKITMEIKKYQGETMDDKTARKIAKTIKHSFKAIKELYCDKNQFKKEVK